MNAKNLARPTESNKLAMGSPVGREGKYLTFLLANEEYGIGILKVREIIGMLPIRSVPQAQWYPVKNATRPSFGMRLISQRVDMWRVSKFMGHSSERMTENYLRMFPEDMKEFYRKMIGEPIKDKWEVKE